MNDRKYKALKKRTEAYIRKWQAVLAPTCDLSVRYERGGTQGNEDMSVGSNWEYGWATITVNVPLAIQRTDRELEDAVIHEFLHIVLAEMEHAGPEHLEHVCTKLASAFMRVAYHG